MALTWLIYRDRLGYVDTFVHSEMQVYILLKYLPGLYLLMA